MIHPAIAWFTHMVIPIGRVSSMAGAQSEGFRNWNRRCEIQACSLVNVSYQGCCVITFSLSLDVLARLILKTTDKKYTRLIDFICFFEADKNVITIHKVQSIGLIHVNKSTLLVSMQLTITNSKSETWSYSSIMLDHACVYATCQT